MANKEIADLTAATLPLSGAETVHIVQSGNSRNAALSSLATSLKTKFTDDADAHTAVAADNGTVRRFTATATLSLTAAATLGNGWHMDVVADGGDVTIDPDGSETVDGETTLVITDGQSCTLRCDGSRFFTFGISPPSVDNPWVIFNGDTGGILASNRIASVTRTATGKYTVTFAAGVWNSANYMGAGSARKDDLNDDANANVQVSGTDALIQTATTTYVRVTYISSTSFRDTTLVGVQFFGDLA